MYVLHGPVMFLGGMIERRRHRRRRTEVLHDLACALNRRDYDTARELLAPDIVVRDSVGRRIEGLDEFIRSDREFRARAGGPRIDIKTAIDQDGDLLVMGEIESRFADMNGVAYYRLGFDGDRINRIDITRSDDRMTVTKFHALQHN